MPIIYSYPRLLASQLDGEQLFILSDNRSGRPTKSVYLQDIATFFPEIIELNDFKLFGKGFCPPSAVTLQDGDILVYSTSTNTWCAQPDAVPVIPTEIISVDASSYVANNYTGIATPPITQYSVNVIYKIVFANSNTLAGSTLDIDGIGAFPLETADSSGAIGPIDADFITGGLIYYVSFLANTFQLSTSPPATTNSTVSYSNPLPVSITSDVGGVEWNAGETWAAIPDGVDAQGDPIYRGWTLTEIMNRIFYPYQNPAFTDLYMVGQSTTLEVGTSVTGGNRDFKWTWNNYFDNIEPNTLEINDITSPINTGATNPLVTGQPTNDPGPIPAPSQTPTISVSTPIGLNIQPTVATSHSWQARATTTSDNPSGPQVFFSSASIFTIRWYYKWYWGTSALTQLSNIQIPTLLNDGGISDGTVNITKSFDATGNGSIGEYWYLAFPNLTGTNQNFGNLNNWFYSGNQVSTGPIGAPYTLDQGGTDVFRFYMEVPNVQVNGGLGNSITYRVYRTKQLQNGVSPALISI